MRQLLLALGLSPQGGNYESVRRRIADLNIDASHLGRRSDGGRTLRDCSDEDIAEAVQDSRSMAEVLVRLKVKPGGNQSRLGRRVQQLGIDTSHFLGKAWRRGAVTAVRPARPVEEFLVEG
ncbi:MAG TPA: hypothetical protein VKA30_10310, partial [Actinomycetota bacterium]|nr:hypothetical protein [Actinomycetota bacterium]